MELYTIYVNLLHKYLQVPTMFLKIYKNILFLKLKYGFRRDGSAGKTPATRVQTPEFPLLQPMRKAGDSEWPSPAALVLQG